jgi:ABC-type multidrug transport system fused ATPase/permease subunit
VTEDQTSSAPAGQEQWLRRYYFIRTAFSAAWVAAAFTVGRQSSTIGTILLVTYPAWDALANYIDASRSGGLGRNRTQATNVVVSAATTLAAVFAVMINMNWVIGVFGVWAILSGLLQLGTGARRWKSYGAQWAMILRGNRRWQAHSSSCRRECPFADPSLT